jgi:hypothetical protein
VIAFLAALHATVTDGRMEPGQSHRYARDPRWPGCWCGRPEADPFHGGRAGR